MRVLSRPIGKRQQRFINDIYAHLTTTPTASAREIRRDVTPELSVSTVRTWLHHMYEIGWLDRDKPEGNTWRYFIDAALRDRPEDPS